MTHKELYSICHDEAVAYANLEQWSKRNAEQKACLIQGYLDAMMKMRKSEITEKKKEYPKTYEECCKIIHSDPKFYVDTHLYSGTLGALYKLLICRDAYWKIAGEELGLGKPWEPDWRHGKDKFYCICTTEGEIVLGEWYIDNKILAFPTKEMRDAFKENFDPDIEICKELL